MKSATGTRFWWLATMLGVLCLQTPFGLTQSNQLKFHLARIDYFAGADRCADPSNPVAKAMKNTKIANEESAQLSLDLATRFPGDECAQRIITAILLASKVVNYMRGHGIAVIPHAGEATDLEQQLAKLPPSAETRLLLHCVLIYDSRANQLTFICIVKLVKGDTVGETSWHRDKPLLDKLVDLYNEETSANITELCRNWMRSQAGRH